MFTRVLEEVRQDEDPESWYALSQTCHAADRFDWLDQVSLAGMQAHPESTKLLVERADSLYHQGNLDEAEKMCRRTIVSASSRCA